ncbi:MAG: prephenate dehydrogenase [Candidatus Omnitrophica bacterium]|nr:prephenate dehydrogenase [Candidatus Omnitrophota bacterium]MBU4590746.1 prephenate dehydrogenase [Candidatus Omnitrophota bacterium]
MFKRITIIGLGLIGGSLGLAIKRKRLARNVVGVSRRKTTIRSALSLRTVDSATLDLAKGVKDADLVILTAPVLTIINIARRISKHLKKGAIVIDAGSTKKNIVKKVEAVLPRGASFIGSHPIAGSEKSGVMYADRNLFKGARCILTKTSRTDSKALGKVKRFWAGLGMKVEIMTPDKHDKSISKVSHLPHAVSAALVNSCNKKDLHLAAGGFKDTTRIASGSPELWKDIFLTNRQNVLSDIKIFKRELSKIEKALKKASSEELLRLLKKAKSVRDSI